MVEPLSSTAHDPVWPWMTDVVWTGLAMDAAPVPSQTHVEMELPLSWSREARPLEGV